MNSKSQHEVAAETVTVPTAKVLRTAIDRINEIILGKDHSVRLALCCLIARGHLLIEDIPGVGKTTLAHTLAAVLGLDFKRIQFTSDLLPADIIGVSIFDAERNTFRFHRGPIFSSLVLADEINRATPKAQSALLEAMQERQVSTEGVTLPLPEPFFVIGTQNPQHQIGTFPLPESQLDRFLMRIGIGYPDHDAERKLLEGADRRTLLSSVDPLLEVSTLRRVQRKAEVVRLSPALLDYIQALLHATRGAPWLVHGLSPRAGLALSHAARAWALLEDRDTVLPEDVQAVAPAVFGHRLQYTEDTMTDAGLGLVDRLIRSVPIP